MDYIIDPINPDEEELAYAITCNSRPPQIKTLELITHIDGEHDGPDWHWVAKDQDEKLYYIYGGCDYTGWDCQSSLFWSEGFTHVKDLIDYLPNQSANDDIQIKSFFVENLHTKLFYEKFDKYLNNKG